MADSTETAADEPAPKKGKKGLIFGLLGAILLGGGGFYATYSGLLLGGGGSEVAETDSHGEPIAHSASMDVAYIELDPLIISLGRFATSRHLRFRGVVEVEPAAKEDVAHLTPRILDVLNTYLRAISETEMEDPAQMNVIRAQMLRRIQVVAGRENVRDLLITEFVLN